MHDATIADFAVHLVPEAFGRRHSARRADLVADVPSGADAFDDWVTARVAEAVVDRYPAGGRPVRFIVVEGGDGLRLRWDESPCCAPRSSPPSTASPPGQDGGASPGTETARRRPPTTRTPGRAGRSSTCPCDDANLRRVNVDQHPCHHFTHPYLTHLPNSSPPEFGSGSTRGGAPVAFA